MNNQFLDIVRKLSTSISVSELMQVLVNRLREVDAFRLVFLFKLEEMDFISMIEEKENILRLNSKSTVMSMFTPGVSIDLSQNSEVNNQISKLIKTEANFIVCRFGRLAEYLLILGSEFNKPIEKSLTTDLDMLINVLEMAIENIQLRSQNIQLENGLDLLKSSIDRIPEMSSSEKASILICEDESSIRLNLLAVLSAKYDVIASENGKEGFRMAIDKIPDLIIADWMMPELNGVELTRKLKKENLTSHIPIIMLTAKSENEDTIEGFNAGADEYLIKPFETSILFARIENLIVNRQRLWFKYASTSIKERKQKFDAPNDKFLNKVYQHIQNNINNNQYTVEQLGTDIGMSRSQLHRKLSSISGEGPNKLIRRMRVEKAAELLQEKALNINEVMYTVGFTDPSYFAKCFQEFYLMSPSAFKQRLDG